jgi:hypothetical protein
MKNRHEKSSALAATKLKGALTDGMRFPTLAGHGEENLRRGTPPAHHGNRSRGCGSGRRVRFDLIESGAAIRLEL